MDIADIVPSALSTLTAWIGQRPTLFAGTIRENIAFARPEAKESEVEEAARLAGVTEFAVALVGGLDTRIGEGGHGISGGQAQRVAIARAFLKDAPLLLLDEPTSHLDPVTEAAVLASLRRLAVGRTVVMATHSAAAHAFGGRRLDLREGRAVLARGAA
jgi:ATP-binding cassette subfamily C protein CydD